MPTLESDFKVLERFELIRRYLGHPTTLTAADLGQLRELADPERRPTASAQELLELYQAQLLVAADLVRSDELPEPIVPIVDPSYGRVSYQSRSGNTRIAVELRPKPARLRMRRPGPAIDPTDGFRIGLAILAGFLADHPDRATDRPDDVLDPRNAARPQLTRVFGPAQAEYFLRDYTPHWGGWKLEQEVAAAEATLRSLRQRRRGLHARRLDQPPAPPPAEPLFADNPADG